jgi:ABC-type Fe3+ transport system substrate-binding protein
VSKLTALGTTDPRSMRDVLWAAFASEGLADVELVYRQEVRTERVLAAAREARPGDGPDLVFVSDPTVLAEAGLLEPSNLSSIPAPAGWLDPGQRWVPLYVQPIVAIHNVHYGPPPATWSDLGAQRFRGRVVFEAPWEMVTTGPALAELSVALKQATWLGTVEGLASQEPLIVADNERSVLEVATGSKWVGLSNWNVAKRVRPGSPVRHVFLDPTPCVPGFGALMRGGANPELGARFLAWLASDPGQRAYAATGRIPAWLDLDVPTSLSRVLPGTQPLHDGGWIHEPAPWVERFRGLFRGDSKVPVAEGKLGRPS